MFTLLNSSNNININFNGLQVMDLVKITSKIINKNILLTANIPGKVDFIANKKTTQDDVVSILMFVLESKGYVLIENRGILRIVKSSDAIRYNLPIYENKHKKDTNTIVTEIIKLNTVNVDYMSAKVRHLLSKTAKLISDARTNSIIITDFKDNIKTIKKVISLLLKDGKQTTEVVTLKNLKVTDISQSVVNMSKAFFNQKIQSDKVNVISDKNSNSLILTGNKKNIKYIKKYIIKLDDKKNLNEKVLEVIYMNNLDAKNVIKILQSLINNKKYKDTENKPFASTDDESNAIILMGPKSEIAYFKKVIAKLDIPRQQVYVKAQIIEISELKSREVGMKYGILGGSSGQDGLYTMSANLGGSAVAIDTSSIGLSLPTLTEGLALGATINLLAQNNAADLISEPSLLCLNNRESTIYVGETKTIKTGSSTSTAGSTNDTFKREDIGLTLKAKPRISDSGKVLLELTAILEDVRQSTTNGQPDTSKKEIHTVAVVHNGESVILGGYTKSKKETTIDKIPFFGDIPLIGALFRNEKAVTDKINLVIIVTPYIVPKSKDLTFVRNELANLKILEDDFTQRTMNELEKKKLILRQKQLDYIDERLDIEDDKQDMIEDELDMREDVEEYIDDIDDSDKEYKNYLKQTFGV